MTERPFSDSRYSKALFGAMRTRRPTVGALGESHASDHLAYAIQYACARYYHADIIYDYRSYANGGTMFAVGGTTTTGTNGLTTQIVQFEARPTDIAFIASGYNDGPTAATAPASVATVISVANRCFAAGASTVVIVGMTPWTTQNVAGWETYNTLMQNWCRSTPGAIFMDVTSVISDMAAASGAMAYRLTGSVQNSLTEDGTHWSGYGARLIAPLIADIFRLVAPERKPRANLSAGAYDPVNKPWINLLGDAGNCLGTSGGYDAGLDTGVVGTSSASRLWISPYGPTSTNSIVTGSLGERKQRMTLGGTTGMIQAFVMPSITNVNNSDDTRRYDYECVIDLVGVTGLSDIISRPISTTYQTPSKNNASAQLWPDNTTESLFYYSLFPFPISGNNPNFNHIFSFAKAPSGGIELSRMSCMRVV